MQPGRSQDRCCREMGSRQTRKVDYRIACELLNVPHYTGMITRLQHDCTYVACSSNDCRAVSARRGTGVAPVDSASQLASGSKWAAVVRRKWRGVVQTSREAQRHASESPSGNWRSHRAAGEFVFAQIRARWRSASNIQSRLNMANMHAFGQTGVDLYIDGVYRNTAIAGRDSKPGLTQEHSFYKDQPRIDREITLYLPLYMPVKVLGIGLDADARVQAPKSFALDKPIVFYGTSITQGGCASRSGMSYQAILGRMLNADFVNLGFSGNGKGEPEMARTVAGIDASYFVLDFAQNNPTVESLMQVYAPFVDTIRSKHPQTPILVVTPIYSARESWSADARLDKMRELIRQVARAADCGRRPEY